MQEIVHSDNVEPWNVSIKVLCRATLQQQWRQTAGDATSFYEIDSPPIKHEHEVVIYRLSKKLSYTCRRCLLGTEPEEN